MNFEEFLKPQETEAKVEEQTNSQREEQDQGINSEEISETVDLDVQKAVVESLAAEKVEQDETIGQLRQENAKLQSEIAELQSEIAKLNTQCSALKQKVEEQNQALAQVGETLAKNAETEASNKVALLDREMELPDRFPGETRDQVLEAIRDAREKAEAEGRVRRAQILESVLVANEPSGNLEKKRAALEKFFNENQNILSGPVIEELERCGISHKKGEEYLLPSEILKRTY